MLLIYYIISALLFLASTLPFVPHQHWMFRVWEFGRLQLMTLQAIILTIGLLFIDEKHTFFWITVVVHAGLLVNHFIILIPYTSLYPKKKMDAVAKQTESISIISVNVYQFNEQFERLLQLIREVKPDILLTLETNQVWEDAMTVLETEYPYHKKVALENTYGMHFYTKLPVISMKVHYFVADDLPSIEVRMQTENGIEFTFFGVHPPPPSPTEEDTSKERDGELLALGKKVLDTDGAVIVVGDFNNVAWARSSILFRKTSQLVDPRIGHGFVSTYHANYRLLRFPIDLCFHSPQIFIEDLKTLRPIGSDHLPLFCKFFINIDEDMHEEEVETLDVEEAEEVEDMIEDGIEEEGERPPVQE